MAGGGMDVNGDGFGDGGEGTTLNRLLREANRRRPASATERRRLLDTAQLVVDARIDAIVLNKHRGAYARAAALAVAHAEAIDACGKHADALQYLAGVRSRFPRHVAFRSELDQAAHASTLTTPRPNRPTGRATTR